MFISCIVRRQLSSPLQADRISFFLSPSIRCLGASCCKCLLLALKHGVILSIAPDFSLDLREYPIRAAPIKIKIKTLSCSRRFVLLKTPNRFNEGAARFSSLAHSGSRRTLLFAATIALVADNSVVWIVVLTSSGRI